MGFRDYLFGFMMRNEGLGLSEIVEICNNGISRPIYNLTTAQQLGFRVIANDLQGLGFQHDTFVYT